MATGAMNGNSISDKEVLQQDLVREQIRQEASALVRRVAEGYSALRSLMEQNPWLTQEMDAQDRERKRAFDEKLQQGLRRANDAPRCRWIYQGGTSCGSPQMRNHIYCYAHRQMMEARALALQLPAAEDANSIQVGLMRIQKALIDDTISTKKAGLLLYSMQLAMTNVGKTTFGKAADDDLVTNTMDEAEAISQEIGISGHRDIGSSENDAERMVMKPIFTRDIPGLREYQTSFTAENAEDAEENKKLPRIGADNRGSKPLDEHGFTTMRVGPLAQGDLGQMHAKMG